MAILSTGPIENRPLGGVRHTQQVTAKFVNRDLTNSSTVLGTELTAHFEAARFPSS